MLAKKLELSSFRSAEKEKIEFCDGINILLGDNAQGKTNALEAVYLFAQGRSFRPSKEREFISYGKETAVLKLDFFAENREQFSEIRYGQKGKSVKKNGVSLRKLSEFIGAFRAVVFCPEHLTMIKNGPHERRKFLDSAISQLSFAYVGSLQRYYRVLEQKNRLLARCYENRKEYDSTAPLWNMQLAKEAAFISQKRDEYVKKLNEEAKIIFSALSNGKEIPEFRYNELRSEEEFSELFEKNTERDIRSGTTNGGIHKDDIEITLNGKSARAFASQGQQRSLALAMKLSEAEISAEKTGEYPVLLLDDVLSELDENRKNFVSREIKKGQVIITACEKDVFCNSAANVINVAEGKYF